MRDVAASLGVRRWSLPVGVLALSACAAVGGSSPADAPAIGLRRGDQWSTLSVRPPHLVGQRFELLLRANVLTGLSSPAGAGHGGALRVKVSDDGAEGFAPFGPVAMDYSDEPAGVVADGQWNGGRVHLLFGADAIRGSVADESRSYCSYDLHAGRDGALDGPSICAGMPQPTRLEIPGAASRWLTSSELITVVVALLAAPPEATGERGALVPSPSTADTF